MITSQWLQTTGGPSSHVNNLSIQLRKAGNYVWILSPEAGAGALFIGTYFVMQIWNIYRLLNRLVPDVVHIHGRIHFIPAALLYNSFRTRKCKLIFSFHTQPYLQDFIEVSPKGKPDYVGFRKYIAKWLISKCDVITSCSYSLISNLNTNYNMEIDNFTVLYTGADLPSIDETKLKLLRDDLGLAGCYPILTSIGVFSWDWKVAGHQICIEAVSRLKDKFPNIRLLIVGRGRFEEYLYKLVRERNLEEHVLFLGYTDSIREVFEISDIYVHMALNEAMGLSLVEAMHANKPIIVANRGGLPELIKNGVSGMVIEPNADELANSVSYLLQNVEVRLKFAENAHSFARNALTLECFARNQMDIYAGQFEKLSLTK